MPWLSPHPCRHPGCGTLIRGSRGFCEEHQAQARKRQDELRPSAARRGYGKDWRRRRAEYLEEHPFCVRPLAGGRSCQAETTVVDHIVPLAEGGADDEGNWQALCKTCHDSWKQRHDRERAKRRPGG
jgi:5-methylcytosine-specific restriction protein A